MFDEMTKKYVEAAVGSETQNAVENWGLTYNSLHEGYAVLKEEVEEADYELQGIKNCLNTFWDDIKQNKNPSHNVQMIKDCAESLSLEACQIAAVCNKILNGLKNETKADKND